MKLQSLRMYNFINKPLNLLGLELTLKRKAVASCHKRMIHMKNLGFSPKVIFDCGAYTGEWALMISRIFPEAQFVLIEPNKRILYKTNENISTINPRPLLLDVAIGANPGTGFLNIWGDDLKTFEGASLLSHIKGNAENKIKTEITTIDMISKSTGFIPDFVKLDLQGTELDALRGAESILERTELFVVEFGCLEAYKNRTTPRDLLNIMYENGYSLYDITDLIYRPFDGALVGGDFFFIKNNSLLKAYKDYN